MSYEPKVGKEFPVSSVKEKTKYLTEFTRSTIAICLVVTSVLALVVTAAVCAYRGDFDFLQTLWAVIGPLLGSIVGYYFRGSDRGDENYQSSA
jgi:membrane protein DedA with SNARE-associated domain